MVMFSSNNELIGEMVDKKAESCYACHTANEPLEKLPMQERMRIYRVHPDSSRILGIINPIYNEKSCWDEVLLSDAVRACLHHAVMRSKPPM
jgi:hypothetical protein